MSENNDISDMKDKEETWRDWHDQLVGLSMMASPLILGIELLLMGLEGSLWQAAIGAAYFAWFSHVANESNIWKIFERS